MDHIHRAESSFSVQRFLLCLLLFQNISLILIKCQSLQEDICPSKCMCDSSYRSGTVSVACNDLELTEIPTILSSESVVSFDVSNNILTHIKEHVFKDYGILENLSLSGSRIEQIDSTAFYGLKMLINIDLSYNNLRSITPTMFSDTPFLQTVSFRGNPLVYVPASSPLFVSPSITSLDLSYCDLTSVNRHTFSQLPGLQVLDLYSNELREFNRDILNSLTEISVIDLGNNRWKCDCNIVEILNWLSERRRSKGLLGEHEPVKCEDAGVLKTIWSSTSRKELCSELAEILPNASALKAPTASSDSTTDITILCVTCSLMLLIYVAMALLIVSQGIFSKKPLTLSLNSSEYLTNVHDIDSCAYIGDRSNNLQKMLSNCNGKKTE